MQICEYKIDALRDAVRAYMSEKRYVHTLGVEEMAKQLAKYCLPDKIAPIRCAALLHDIAKEMPKEEQLSVLASMPEITDSDLASSPAHHAFCAPYLIKRDFPEFATTDILSAVFNHTTGHPDMSLFDEIIFLADYIEEGREYAECIRIRESLLNKLRSAKDAEECLLWLHKAVIAELDSTLLSLTKRGMYINERTVATRNAFIGRMPMPLEL